jgi:release factor glutamine methyltransferase
LGGVDPSKLEAVKFLEIGVGTGAISVLLKKRMPVLSGLGIDVNPRCVQLANLNKDRNLGAGSANGKSLVFEQRDFYSGDEWLDGGKVDFIISNPPYVSHQDYSEFERQILDWESKLAFVSDNQGLDFTIRILKFAETNLADGGFVLLELCPKTIARLEDELNANPKFTITGVYQDIFDRKRFICFKLRNQAA